MQRIVVTGASGFIGRHVVRALADRGARVTATGRNGHALATLNEHAVCVRADLSTDALEPLLDGADAVVHCAALSSPWGKEVDFFSTNVTATERLLSAARATGVGRFVHISSPSIYFEFKDALNIREDFVPRQHVNAYAKTKWQAEQCVRRAFQEGLATITLRPRAVFGEGDAAIMPRILKIARRGSFPLFGGGSAQIDVTYVGNVVQAVLLAIDAGPAAMGQSFNITNDAPTDVRSLLSTMFESLAWQVRFISVPRSVALGVAGALEFYARHANGQQEPRLTRYGVGVLGYAQTLNIAAAKQQLGYRPRWLMQDGIQRYADWYRKYESH